MALSTKKLVCAALGAWLSAGCAEEPVGVGSQAAGLERLGSVSGIVYYDANTNGRLDEGEAGMKGVEILYSNGSDGRTATDEAGRFTVQVPPGTYSFMQHLLPRPTWIQTGNLYEQWKTEGSSRVSLDWSKSYSVNVVEEGVVTGLHFGNVCVAGGGARPTSFWMSMKGSALVSNVDVAKLSEMELKGPNGDFDPSTAAELAAWLRSAQEGTPTIALSAELAALKLSVLHGFVREDALVRARGARSSNVSEFAIVRELFDEVNEVLGERRPEIRVEARKAALLTALADANDNRSFAQADPRVCRPDPK